MVPIGLTLIGDAIGDAGLYITSLLHCGVFRRVLLVESVDLQGQRHQVGVPGGLDTDRLVLMSFTDVCDLVPRSRSARLRLVSPLRLFRMGAPVARFDFPLLFRSLLRRMSSLSAYYCGDDLGLDYQALSRSAGDIVCTAGGVSPVAPDRARVTGLTGDVFIEGDLADLLPVLKAGEFLHVGKGASSGFGRFLVEPL